MKKSIWMTIALMLVVSSIGGMSARSDTSNELKAKPAYIAMFKNGIGLVVTRVTLPKPSGTYRIHPLPDAALGSFWLHWPDSLQLSEMTATQATVEVPVPAATIKELLEANIGDTVDLLIKDEWTKARIIDMPRRHDDPILQPQEKDVIPVPPPKERSDMVLIEDSTGIRAIKNDWIDSIRLTDEEPKYEIMRPQVENVLQFTAAPAEENNSKTPSEEISLTYLAKGIAWTPSYVVDITNKEKATFTAKAVIVNDLMPLENTDVELIAGYPHIKFGETNSTFSLTPLNQILEGLRNQGSRVDRALDIVNNPYSNVMSQRAAFAPGAPMPSGPSAPVMGEGAEDLYFYHVEGVTLKKGERGYYPLFTGSVPYEHVYTWDISNYIDENVSYRRQPEESEPQQIVWHSLKLTNSTGNPWTTAPAMTMKDGRILGQDTVNYTPDKAETDLKITQAISIHAEQNEYEIDRQRSASEFYGSRFDLVTVNGELAVTNFKDETVKVEISKELLGEVVKADGNPEIVKLASGLRRVNPQSKLVWKIEAKPGKDNVVKLTYTFKVYVRE